MLTEVTWHCMISDFFKVTLFFFCVLFNLVVAGVKDKNLLNIVVHGAVQPFPPDMPCATSCLLLSLGQKIIHNAVYVDRGIEYLG